LIVAIICRIIIIIASQLSGFKIRVIQLRARRVRRGQGRVIVGDEASFIDSDAGDQAGGDEFAGGPRDPIVSFRAYFFGRLLTMVLMSVGSWLPERGSAGCRRTAFGRRLGLVADRDVRDLIGRIVFLRDPKKKTIRNSFSVCVSNISSVLMTDFFLGCP
jgi:hypothetical protein